MRRKRRKSLAKYKPIAALLVFLFLSTVTLFVANRGAHKPPTLVSQLNTPPVPSSTPTPIPTPTLTPTPTIPPGFCLRVPILLYHHIQPHEQAAQKGQLNISVDNGVFDQQMAHLKSFGYTTLTARQLIDALRANTPLPAKSILITLDDGYRDNYEHAFPIFKKYGITANIMLATGLMEGADYLTWDQIRDMKNSGLVYYTNHTWSHYGLGRGNTEKIRYEITTADSQIEQNTGQSVDIFTYPYGSFTNQSIAILQELGYSGGFSTIPGSYQCDSIIFTLRRTRIGNASLSAYGL